MFLWFWVGDHDKTYCKPFIHPLYALIVPFVRVSSCFLVLRLVFNSLSQQISAQGRQAYFSPIFDLSHTHLSSCDSDPGICLHWQVPLGIGWSRRGSLGAVCHADMAIWNTVHSSVILLQTVRSGDYNDSASGRGDLHTTPEDRLLRERQVFGSQCVYTEAVLASRRESNFSFSVI